MLSFIQVGTQPLPHRRKKSAERMDDLMEKNIDKINQHLIKKRGLRRFNRMLTADDRVTYINR